MCNHVVILAERAGQRYISHCEHGTVHFVWDAVGLHLPAPAFLQLAEGLLAAETVYHAAVAGSELEHFHLQVGRMLVVFPMADFPLVLDLLQEALPRVARPGAEAIVPPRVRFPTARRTVVLN